MRKCATANRTKERGEEGEREEGRKEEKGETFTNCVRRGEEGSRISRKEHTYHMTWEKCEEKDYTTFSLTFALLPFSLANHT